MTIRCRQARYDTRIIGNLHHSTLPNSHFKFQGPSCRFPIIVNRVGERRESTRDDQRRRMTPDLNMADTGSNWAVNRECAPTVVWSTLLITYAINCSACNTNEFPSAVLSATTKLLSSHPRWVTLLRGAAWLNQFKFWFSNWVRRRNRWFVKVDFLFTEEPAAAWWLVEKNTSARPIVY